MPATRTKTELVRLGALRETRSLSPRDALSDDAIKHYVRRLQNGDVPPPIQVEAKTNEIFAGRHRFHAYRQFFGDGWESKEVSVIWRHDLPNPDEQPNEFRILAAADNNNHGVPITRVEKRRALADIAKQSGMETAYRYAPMLGETAESAYELVKPFLEMAAKTLEAVQEGVDASVKAAPRGVADVRRPEAFHLSGLHSVRPAIIVECDRMLDAMRRITDQKLNLTEGEKLKLRQVDEALHMLLE